VPVVKLLGKKIMYNLTKNMSHKEKFINELNGFVQSLSHYISTDNGQWSTNYKPPKINTKNEPKQLSLF
jgi:hypothetical protein